MAEYVRVKIYAPLQASSKLQPAIPTKWDLFKMSLFALIVPSGTIFYKGDEYVLYTRIKSSEEFSALVEKEE